MKMDITKKVAQFFSTFKQKSFHKGDIIVNPEETDKGIYYIKSGVVRMYTITSDGDELTLNIFKPSSFFPLGKMMSDIPNRYYFDALEPVEASVASSAAVKAFLHSEPAVLFDLVQRIYRGLDGYFMRMESLLVGSAKRLVLTVLIIQADRLGNEIHISQSQIATLTGLTRETVSRQISKLHSKGLVFYEKNVLHIPDLEKLRALFASEK